MNPKSGKVKKNYFFNLMYQVLLIILPIITAPYVSRVLRPEGVGKYNYATSIGLIYIMVAALGTSIYAIREISCIRNDKVAVSKLFWELLIIRIMGVIFIAPVYIFHMYIFTDYTEILGIVGIQVFGSALDISWLYQGKEDFKKTVTRSIAVRVISVILVFLFVKTPDDVVLYTLINCGGVFIGNLLLWINIPKAVVKIPFNTLRVNQHLKPVLLLLLPALSIYMYTNFNKVILGYFTSEAEVGFFSQSYSIITLIMTVITSLGTVLIPNIAFLIKDEKWDEVRTMICDSMRFVFFGSFPMMFGLFSISPIFVPWFLGNEYEACILIMKILSPLVFIVGVASVTGQAVLVPLRKQNVYTVSIFAGAAVSIVLNFVLIPQYKSYGASFALVASELTVTTIQLCMVCKYLKIKAGDLWRISKDYFIASLIMFITIFPLVKMLYPNMVMIFFIVFLASIIYVFCLIALKDKYILKYIKYLKKSRR